MYAGRFSNARHSLEETQLSRNQVTAMGVYRDDDVRAVPVLRDDLEPVNRLLVSDDIIQDLRSVLFYPRCAEKPRRLEPSGCIPW
jgi:hypothetical protein